MIKPKTTQIRTMKLFKIQIFYFKKAINKPQIIPQTKVNHPNNKEKAKK
jgi:hypothetical protein